MATGNLPLGPESAMIAPDDTVLAVTAALKSLRKRSGLVPGRVHRTQVDLRSLLRLSVVRHYAHRGKTTPEVALLEAIRHVACNLEVTDRLIVDAELCLGMLRDHPPAGIDLRQFYATELTARRRYLTLHWRRLHEALGATTIPGAPSVRTLREAPEERAFTALATLLTSASDPEAAERKTVTIIGDAVMDMIVEVDNFPRRGVPMWGDFRRRPGGKGLKRAVTLAKLGLETRLLTAIGNDREGREILDYLAREGVDTSLIKMVSELSTPVTIMIEAADGEEYTPIAAKRGRTQLASSDLDQAANLQALTDVKAVLLTFEQSVPVIERTLEAVGAQKNTTTAPGPPWLVVNVAPQRPLTAAMSAHLSAIDHLVGSPDEIAALRPDQPPESVAGWLLDRGVGSVCVIERSRCTIHRAGAGTIEVCFFDNDYPGVSGAASAFSSALTYRLVSLDRAAVPADFEWATAAMADLNLRAARMPPGHGTPDTMAAADAIDAIVAESSTRSTQE
ncbi:PfkB family carbohydrate kinase [Nocardia sp. CDC153]|uniref:carbohydrate kinase family protein n=1 Tax=Nocardia sp. CDC153 TaxID=3112167 RepID=UPI002DBECA85|nr:PfkB family carbohydrate kinase [Nocardia sp. CDC153]MEC3956328.1 PfkB family carbohydrate kinase [Nocardia sp. CDC153]